MLYKREGMPEEDELVLCTITSVQHHSVFAMLDEYGKTGMIHISEVSPGRIRNIRDYVQEGKKTICKVLRVDPVRGHIDLSLRRVTEMQRRKKMDDIKKEQKAEKIVEIAAKKLGKDIKLIYDELGSKVFENYEYLAECFDEVVADAADLEKMGVSKEIAKIVEEVAREKIKPEEVEIKGKLSLVSYAPDGVEIVKKALEKAEEVDKNRITVKYCGAGKYAMCVKAPDYKEAEEIVKKSVERAVSFIEKNGGKGSFERN